MEEKIKKAEEAGLKNTEKEIRHLLLIDDDKISNMIISRQITNMREGVKITQFEDSQKALSYLANPANEFPDAILLDLIMPKTDGWQFLEALEQSCLLIPIYIITVSIQPEDRKKANNYENTKNFFSKPLEVGDINILLKADS